MLDKITLASTKWWSVTREVSLSLLKVNQTHGLDTPDVEMRREYYGKNSSRRSATVSPLKILLEQVLNPLVFLLIFASLFSFYIGEVIEGAFVALAVLINVLLGFWQEYKAGNAILSLEKLLVDKTKVLRSGKKIIIDSEDLVIGDIVLLKSGDKVPADMRIVYAKDAYVNESILTGEVVPVQKSAHHVSENTLLADRNSILYAGTAVENGDLTGVVVATGQYTELGKIAALVDGRANEEHPLYKAMKKFTRILVVFLVLLGVSVFVLGTSRGESVNEMILLAIAVIVSAIPESLPIAMSVVLSRSATTLAKSGTVVRKMIATETLGSVTTIVTDKTGTITEGILRLSKIICIDEKSESQILYKAAVNTDIDIAEINESSEIKEGTPVERALLGEVLNRVEGKENILKIEKLKRLYFNSKNKYAATVIHEKGHYELVVLGAPDILIKLAKYISMDKKELLKTIDELAYSGSRVVGLLTAKLSKEQALGEVKIEDLIKQADLSYAGLLSFKDPIKQGVRESVASLHERGIVTILCTGDHPGTALAIAKEAKIVPVDYNKIYTNLDIENASDDEMDNIVRETKVFARVTPRDKLRIVEALKRIGETVAVTGDGVNDAPALKTAHIGAAMGSGSDVSRDASDIVIVDNNYRTIATAVMEGRNVLQRLRSVIIYLLADVFDELLLIGGALFMGLAIPLSALQILFVKFFSDIFPAMAFTFEESHTDESNKYPMSANSIFGKDVKLFTMARGVISSGILLVLYVVLIKLSYDKEIVKTFIYVSFATYLLFLSFSIRNISLPLTKIKVFGNMQLFFGVVFGFGTILLSIYVPFLQKLLGTVALPPEWFLGVIAIGLLNLGIMEVMKYIVNNRSKKIEKYA